MPNSALVCYKCWTSISIEDLLVLINGRDEMQFFCLACAKDIASKEESEWALASDAEAQRIYEQDGTILIVREPEHLIEEAKALSSMAKHNLNPSAFSEAWSFAFGKPETDNTYAWLDNLHVDDKPLEDTINLLDLMCYQIYSPPEDPDRPPLHVPTVGDPEHKRQQKLEQQRTKDIAARQEFAERRRKAITRTDRGRIKWRDSGKNF